MLSGSLDPGLILGLQAPDFRTYLEISPPVNDHLEEVAYFYSRL
jgi:hypothetical protein